MDTNHKGKKSIGIKQSTVSVCMFVKEDTVGFTTVAHYSFWVAQQYNDYRKKFLDLHLGIRCREYGWRKGSMFNRKPDKTESNVNPRHKFKCNMQQCNSGLKSGCV